MVAQENHYASCCTGFGQDWFKNTYAFCGPDGINLITLIEMIVNSINDYAHHALALIGERMADVACQTGVVLAF
jgi:hypothetical protein